MKKLRTIQYYRSDGVVSKNQINKHGGENSPPEASETLLVKCDSSHSECHTLIELSDNYAL